MAIDPSRPPKKVDWEAAKVCLAELQREAPSILQQAVVIGGIACWFYRNLLSKANDPDRAPEICKDGRVVNKLRTIIDQAQSLSPSEANLLSDLSAGQ